MTLVETGDIITAARDGRPLQWKTRWFPTIEALAAPHAPAGETLVEWHDLVDDRDHFDFANYLYRVKP